MEYSNFTLPVGRVDFLDAVVLLAPVLVVDIVFVIAGFADRDLEEIGILQHRRRRHESAAGMAGDADALDIDPRIAARQLLDCGFLIGQAVVAQVAVAEVVIPLRPVRIAAAIAHFDHDEPEFRQRDVRVRGKTSASRFPSADPDNERDDRILLVGVEIERLVHDAVEIGQAVVGFHLERSGMWKPASINAEISVVSRSIPARRRVVQQGARSAVDGGRVVDEIFPVVRHGHRVRRVAGIQQLQSAAIQLHAVEMREVRIFAAPGLRR